MDTLDLRADYWIALVTAQPGITPKELREAFGLEHQEMRKICKKVRERRVTITTGRGPKARYWMKSYADANGIEPQKPNARCSAFNEVDAIHRFWCERSAFISAHFRPTSAGINY